MQSRVDINTMSDFRNYFMLTETSDTRDKLEVMANQAVFKKAMVHLLTRTNGLTFNDVVTEEDAFYIYESGLEILIPLLKESPVTIITPDNVHKTVLEQYQSELMDLLNQWCIKLKLSGRPVKSVEVDESFDERGECVLKVKLDTISNAQLFAHHAGYENVEDIRMVVVLGPRRAPRLFSTKLGIDHFDTVQYPKIKQAYFASETHSNLGAQVYSTYQLQDESGKTSAKLLDSVADSLHTDLSILSENMTTQDKSKLKKVIEVVLASQSAAVTTATVTNNMTLRDALTFLNKEGSVLALAFQDPSALVSRDQVATADITAIKDFAKIFLTLYKDRYLSEEQLDTFALKQEAKRQYRELEVQKLMNVSAVANSTSAPTILASTSRLFPSTMPATASSSATSQRPSDRLSIIGTELSRFFFG